MSLCRSSPLGVCSFCAVLVHVLYSTIVPYPSVTDPATLDANEWRSPDKSEDRNDKFGPQQSYSLATLSFTPQDWPILGERTTTCDCKPGQTREFGDMLHSHKHTSKLNHGTVSTLTKGRDNIAPWERKVWCSCKGRPEVDPNRRTQVY